MNNQARKGGHIESELRANLGYTPPAPTHWPPRPTRMAVSIRLGIARLLLERAQ